MENWEIEIIIVAIAKGKNYYLNYWCLIVK